MGWWAIPSDNAAARHPVSTPVCLEVEIMDKLNNAPCFQPARILLPAEGTPLNPWACIAVDQFTSQPEYWQQAEALAAGHPSSDALDCL